MDVEIPEAIAADLTQRWNEPHRRHHDQRHLDEVLEALEILRDEGLAFAQRPVVLAAWFHDAVYKPLSSTNEQDSADLARRLLVDDPDRDEIARLVELTTAHDPAADDANGIALSDADFAVLGSAPERYDEYAANVREEFRRVPGRVFRRKRAELLTEFLEREHIFMSPQARERWEAPARENIAREIAALRGSDDGNPSGASFTYAGVGATLTTPPSGYHAFTRRRRIGSGRPLFERAAEHVLTFGMQKDIGIFRAASTPTAQEGTELSIRLGVGPLGITAPCRVVYVLDEPDRRGFAYGTLPGHPESGEELFAVEYDPADDGVYGLVSAFSRPAAWYARMGGPVTRLLQAWFARRYLAALPRS